MARARPWLARGLLRHAAEEMACLSFFLPAFYEEERRLIGGLRLFNKRRSTILQSSIATQQNNEVEGKSPSFPSPPPSPFGDEQRAAALTILERMTSSMDENDPSFKLDDSKKKGGASGDSDTQQQCIIS
uniref:Uncharacterized protein n=1 Tax=Heterosigma akashiwo TaxID=2829 RepID=A0A6V1XD66_HETAK